MKRERQMPRSQLPSGPQIQVMKRLSTGGALINWFNLFITLHPQSVKSYSAVQSLDQTVHLATFRALRARGWLEHAHGANQYVLSASGREALMRATKKGKQT
jgi:hypothetical protein